MGSLTSLVTLDSSLRLLFEPLHDRLDALFENDITVVVGEMMVVGGGSGG